MKVVGKIIDILAERVDSLKGIYLYGSRADGSARPDSDYDIAVLSEYPNQLKSLEVFELAVELGDTIHATVDLVDLRTVPIDLRFEVIVNGQQIYCNDRYYCNQYEMTVISMYQRFELERKDLVEAYKKRILSNG